MTHKCSKLTNSSFLVNVTRHDTNFTFSRLRKEWEKSDRTLKPPLRTVQPWAKHRSHLHWWLQGSLGPPAGSYFAWPACASPAPCPAGGCPQWCTRPGASLHRLLHWWQQQQMGEGHISQWQRHPFVLWPTMGTTEKHIMDLAGLERTSDNKSFKIHPFSGINQVNGYVLIYHEQGKS